MGQIFDKETQPSKDENFSHPSFSTKKPNSSQMSGIWPDISPFHIRIRSRKNVLKELAR